MKTSLPIFVTFFILIYSCTSNADKYYQKFSLEGEINNQDTGIIIMEYHSGPALINDTAKIKNGKFLFTGRILEPINAGLFGRNYSELARIYIEPKEMKITVFKGKPLGSKMTGSKTQTEFELLNKMEEPIIERLSELRAKGIIINDSIKNSQDGTVKLLLEKNGEEIDSLWSVTRKELYPIELKFVLENPKSFVSLDYLRSLASSEIISLDSLKSIFNGLDNSLRRSELASYVTEYIRNKEEDIRKKDNIRIGNQAPNFKAKDLNQQQVTLSQFKGNSVVLLDFWASWCIPCRQSIPHLKTLYKKYESKGFKIIAVWKDDFGKREGWIEAVKQDSTEMWYHIPVAMKYPCGSDQITDDDVYKNYFVDLIPQQILIDKNGKIIYQCVGYSKENEDSLDSLLSQIFDN
jgi:thiol-disulfide isomerase/thioredoxin